MLEKLLASMVSLSIKTQNYHWNVKGLHFQPLHDFFEDHYKELIKDIDEVAERITTLDRHVNAGLAAFLEDSAIEDEKGAPDATQMLERLLADRRAVIAVIKEVLEDAEQQDDIATAHLMEELVERYEKVCWMIKAHLD